MNPGVFLYFIPELTPDKITRDWLRESPLADVFRDVWFTGKSFQKLLATREAIHGPGGQHGTILTANLPQGQQFGYYADAQEWRQIDGVWCGYQKDRRPNAEGLQRARFFAGYEVELQDGRAWIAPVIRAWHEDSETLGCELPMVFGLADDSDERRMLVHDLFMDFWALAGDQVEFYTGRTTRSGLKQHEAAVKALSLNYRVGPREVDWLDLLDTDAEDAICRAMVEWNVVNEFLERRRQGTEANPT
jgi:hypothetical protein